MKQVTGAMVAALLLVGSGGAEAQNYQLKQGSFALKGGESTEVGDLYYVVNCHSLLTAPPEVTVLDGPPGVTVSATEAEVLPRMQNCPRPVKGAKLMMKAGPVDDQSSSLMTVRIRYPTKDGAREQSMTFSLALFP